MGASTCATVRTSCLKRIKISAFLRALQPDRRVLHLPLPTPHNVRRATPHANVRLPRPSSAHASLSRNAIKFAAVSYENTFNGRGRRLERFSRFGETTAAVA